MQPAYVVLAALLVPVGAMMLLLWLGRLEDTLDASLEEMARPAVPPLRSVPASTAVRSLPARSASAESAPLTAAS